MVEVEYLGRLGNQLFTYAVSRVIAEALRYKLSAKPVPGFGGTYNVVPGAEYHSPVQQIIQDDMPELADVLQTRPHRKIFIQAYCQNYAYLRDRANDIRAWYRQPPPENPLDPDAVVLHVRLTDFADKYKWAIAMNYYTAVLEKRLSGRPVVVITDEPTHPCLDVLEKYNPVYASDSPLEDFRRMVAAKDLIISTSTFSWWAAFLSKANVFAPLLARGYYSRPEYKNENFVVNEPRYTYVKNVGLLHE